MSSWRRWRGILAGSYSLLATAVAFRYFDHLSPTLLLGGLAILVTPPSGHASGSGFRYGWYALALMALFFIAPLKTIVFAALACGVCCFSESFYQRVPMTTTVILALLTPMAGFFADAFSFPIRLRLSSMAGSLIRIAGNTVIVEGNTITYHDQLFSVDPACMGLHMLVMSLLMALFLIHYYQRRLQRRLPLLVSVLLLLMTTALNIISNLFRIVCLVVFHILPENPLHGIFGMVMLGVYVLLPLVPMIRRAIHRFGHPVLPTGDCPSNAGRRWVLAGNLGLMTALLVLTAITVFKKETPRQPVTASISGYTLRQLPNTILQLDNQRSMVYIKPIPGFYCTDHTPSICWEGSGYTFTTLRVSVIAGLAVFEGSLQKGREKLYTAWWYDNGSRRTIEPFKWRWDYIRGGTPYAVVNVTTATRPQLETEIAHIVQTQPFRPILGQLHQ